MKKTVHLGGIINRRQLGVGFDIIFKTKDEAQRYKEMLMFILKNDKYNVETAMGYHDKGGN